MASYRFVLFATDFSPHSAFAGRRAVEAARVHGARLGVVHVVRPMDYVYCAEAFSHADGISLETSIREVAERELVHQAEALGVGEEERWLRTGSPKREILATASDQGADLIVLGSHGRHGLGRILGSTAAGVLNDAPCDVLAVRLPED